MCGSRTVSVVREQAHSFCGEMRFAISRPKEILHGAVKNDSHVAQRSRCVNKLCVWSAWTFRLFVGGDIYRHTGWPKMNKLAAIEVSSNAFKRCQ